MLTTYIQRVMNPLANALVHTIIMLAFSAESLFIPSIFIPMFLIFVSANYLLTWQLQRLLRGPRDFSPAIQILALIMAVGIAGVSTALLHSHVFLFFSALPLAFSIPFFAVTTFFISFESHIRSTRNNLGPNYSLIKLLLNPREQLVVLRNTLIQPHYGVAARRGPAVNEQNLGGLDQRAVPQRGAAPRPILNDPKSLQLSETERNQLANRQKAAIKALPKDAIIDDFGLYEKYLAAEKKSGTIEQNEKRKNSSLAEPLSRYNLTSSIQTAQQNAAKSKAKDEADLLETKYLHQLSEPQQKAYREYREFIKNYSLLYAECSIIFTEVISHPNEYIILEKREEKKKPQSNETTTTCIRGKTFIFHLENSFLPLFKMTHHAAEEPTSRDPFFLPDNKKSGYVFHTYEMVEGHPLSLQLCEMIENLAPILSPSDTKNLINNTFANDGNNAVVRYRLTPPYEAGSPSNLSLNFYGGRGDFPYELLNTLTDEEKQYNLQYQYRDSSN